MFKNAPLEYSYEPMVTTKHVSSPLPPEIDLPALRQSFKSNVTTHRRSTTTNAETVARAPLNILTHQTLPKYQAYLTQERPDGTMCTTAQQKNFRRKSMLSTFIDKEHSAKNHKEFIAGQLAQPVGLYSRPAGQFSHAAGTKT